MVKDLVCDCGLDATIGEELRVQFPLVTSYICDVLQLQTRSYVHNHGRLGFVIVV